MAQIGKTTLSRDRTWFGLRIRGAGVKVHQALSPSLGRPITLFPIQPLAMDVDLVSLKVNVLLRETHDLTQPLPAFECELVDRIIAIETSFFEKSRYVLLLFPPTVFLLKEFSFLSRSHTLFFTAEFCRGELGSLQDFGSIGLPRSPPMELTKNDRPLLRLFQIFLDNLGLGVQA
jgi:hypothetical protein